MLEAIIILLLIVIIIAWFVRDFFSTVGSVITGFTQGFTKVCPYCRNRIKEKATVCQFCHSDVSKVKWVPPWGS